MSKPAKSSFSLYVVRGLLSSSGSNLYVCCSVFPRDAHYVPLQVTCGEQHPVFSLLSFTSAIKYPDANVSRFIIRVTSSVGNIGTNVLTRSILSMQERARLEGRRS